MTQITLPAQKAGEIVTKEIEHTAEQLRRDMRTLGEYEPTEYGFRGAVEYVENGYRELLQHMDDLRSVICDILPEETQGGQAGTPVCYVKTNVAMTAMQYTGKNAKTIEEFTGGKFEADEDELYLDIGKPDQVRKIEPGTWIVSVPWSPVPYQYVSPLDMEVFMETVHSRVVPDEPPEEEKENGQDGCGVTGCCGCSGMENE